MARRARAEQVSEKQAGRQSRKRGERAVNATDADRSVIIKPATKSFVPLNAAQKKLDAAIKSSDIIFALGPAGTGKTLLTAARAAEALEAGTIEKIFITRPSVTVENESLGFYPGTMEEKYEPYFRPVRDQFEKVFGTTKLEYLLRKKIIEPIPLAHVRGLSIKAWVIADEMQNATFGQFKVLLTRGEENVKFILNGDHEQDDLGPGKSGLLKTIGKLEKLHEVTTVVFKDKDIVRSGLTQKVVMALRD